jgi:ribonuclease J
VHDREDWFFRMKQTVLVYALGGVGEMGKNMYAVEVGRDIVIIDCGLKFPEEDMLGIDIVIPDVAHFIDRKDDVRGIILSHGHEDHIGGLPYVLKSLSVPVYGTRLTMGLIADALKDANVYDEQQLHIIDEHSTIALGQLSASFFRTNHNIPDSVGVVVHTHLGAVVYTSDFKFDFTPVNNNTADVHKMAHIGAQGVLCLLSESTNAERSGHTPSDERIVDDFVDVFHKATQRVVIASFAAHVHRIQQVFRAAQKTGRKVAIHGESMVHVVTVARNLGYLDVPERLLVDMDEAQQLPAKHVVIITTGSHGEPMSALSAQATGQKIEIHKGDTVIVAAVPMPGHERDIGRVVDALFRIGAHVIYGSTHLTGAHVSGHGNQEELKLMLGLMQPKYVIPVHGEYRMLKAHASLAVQVGIPMENVFLIDNGDVVELSEAQGKKVGKIVCGNILIDGLGIGDVGNIVLRDRKLLSEDGIVVIVLTLCKQKGTLLAQPDLSTRGFVYVREASHLLAEATALVSVTCTKLLQERVSEWSVLKNQVRDALGKFLYEQTKRRPMILPIIMEV